MAVIDLPIKWPSRHTFIYQKPLRFLCTEASCIDCNENTFVTQKHSPLESSWPYLNTTSLQEQLCKQACVQSFLFKFTTVRVAFVKIRNINKSKEMMVLHVLTRNWNQWHATKICLPVVYRLEVVWIGITLKKTCALPICAYPIVPTHRWVSTKHNHERSALHQTKSIVLCYQTIDAALGAHRTLITWTGWTVPVAARYL